MDRCRLSLGILVILSLLLTTGCSSLQFHRVQLSSKDVNKRKEAVVSLSLMRSKAKKASEDLIPLILHESDPEVRRLAIEAIGNLKPKITRELSDALMIASNDEDVHIRRAAVISAEQFDFFPYTIIALIQKRLGDSDQMVRELAMSAFEKIGKLGVHSLIRALPRATPEMRVTIITTLGRLGEDASTALVKLKEVQSKDSDERVREAASQAVRVITQLTAVD